MKRGDVVIAGFPQAGPAVPKERPVLVVQADTYNRSIGNVILAAITSNTVRASDPAHYFIDVSTSEGRMSGLHQNSVVSCINLAVLNQGQIKRTIGGLSDAAMAEIDECLKAALGL